MSDGGKGSAPRPFSVDQKTFEENWNAIFGKPDNHPVHSDAVHGDGGIRERKETGVEGSPEHRPGKP
jgi:hypothetical protein